MTDNEEIKITPAMIEAGERVILEEVGGARDLGGYFCARRLGKQTRPRVSATRQRVKLGAGNGRWR
jgi:hypothetical protein